HYYPPAYFERIEGSGGDFSFGTSPTGQRIIRYKGARFFGVTAPMTDVAKRLEDMARVGIDTEVLPLSTPNVYVVEGKAQAAAADAFTEYVLGPIVGFPFDTTVAIAKLCYAGVFKDLPNIRWLVAHAGGAIPYLMERLDSGWRDFAECRVNIDQPPSLYLKRLYYDTVTFSPHNLRLLHDVVGTDHMVMGSDYPHLLGSIDKAVSSIDAMDFTEREKDQLYSGTALSIMNNVRSVAGAAPA